MNLDPLNTRQGQGRPRGGSLFGISGGQGGSGTPYSEFSFFLPLGDKGGGQVDLSPFFAAGSSAATYTRSTVAWTKQSNGRWIQVASGVARSGYFGADTAVGVYGGFFVEAAGTQLVTPTASIRDMTDASWVATNITPAKTATGIDGVVNSCSTLTATAGNGTIFQTLTAAASSRVYSAFIRRRTGVGTISITQDGGSTYTDITAQLNSNTFTRVILNASVLNAAFGFKITTSADAIDVDMNQFETGVYPTSPMASAGAARNADLLLYPYAGNADGTIGTLVATAGYADTATTTADRQHVIATLSTGSIGTLVNRNNQAVTTISAASNGNTNIVQASGLTSLATGMRVRAAGWNAAKNLVETTGDGAAWTTTTFSDGTMGSNSICIGAANTGGNGSQQLGGFIQRVKIYPLDISSGQVVG